MTYYQFTIKSGIITIEHNYTEVQYAWKKLRWIGKVYDIVKNIYYLINSKLKVTKL